MTTNCLKLRHFVTNYYICTPKIRVFLWDSPVKTIKLFSTEGDLGFKAQEFLEENINFDPDPNQESNLTPSNPQQALTTAAKFGKEGKTGPVSSIFNQTVNRIESFASKY